MNGGFNHQNEWHTKLKEKKILHIHIKLASVADIIKIGAYLGNLNITYFTEEQLRLLQMNKLSIQY